MVRNIVARSLSDPLLVPMFFFQKIYVFLLRMNSRINIRGNILVKGKPIIDIKKGSSLYIGEGVTLNSRNKGYHINMHSPVKLYADRVGSKIVIGDNTRIHGTCIHSYQSIEIGKNCLIAANCQIFDGSGHDLSFSDVDNRINTKGISKPIVIGDSVWIGANSIILPGVSIGKGSVIAANSVVSKDIPTMVIAGGNPAHIIKEYKGVNPS